MNTRIKAIAALATAAATALTVTACGSSDSAGGGGGGDTLVIGVDLPFTGSSQTASDSTWDAMNQYLDSIDGKAGDYTIKLKKYDDATAAAGKWDEAQCAANADDHLANLDEIAVMGTYNSGCAAIEIPAINGGEDPLFMVSHANTAVGLTKKWDTGEPDKYYPSGVRTYARVVTTDDYQGKAGAQFAIQDQGVTNCLVLDDTEVYGKGVASTFAAEAKAEGIKYSTQAWDGKATNYNALFSKAKADGVDCVYFGGVFDNNGAQLIKDKVSILGDNSTVKLFAPDGWTGYTDTLDTMPEAEGMFTTFPGLPLSDIAKTEKGGAFLTAYKEAHGGADPANSYAIYGVQALQVILAAIEASDGTRAGVLDAFHDGITISADDAILGKEIAIDGETGDVNAVDMTVQKTTGGAETTFKGWPVS
ncbi:MAG: branched-chain amino acid ABC transporter substrate-binding protein [Nocardioides sp.]|uniref:branched-chain amino acid ABC transporter substrate-binding protein n=1 Tax=Nocardioides sp. TaxID=35761 RepID=UPI0039E566CA